VWSVKKGVRGKIGMEVRTARLEVPLPKLLFLAIQQRADERDFDATVRAHARTPPHMRAHKSSSMDM